MSGKDLTINEKRMLDGKLYFAFDEHLIARRKKCQHACLQYNSAGDVSRRTKVELWREITCNPNRLPSPAPTPEQDDALFANDPWIEPPITVDYGFNFHIGTNVFINFNCIVLDTCEVRIGDRTVIGPNVSFYSATHPLDPGLRNGLEGPELGREIDVGPDCWLGGNVVVLPSVKVGKGSTVGAGSVVTKDVPEYSIVAGNPARVLRRLKESEMTEPHGSLPKKTKEEIILDGEAAAAAANDDSDIKHSTGK